MKAKTDNLNSLYMSELPPRAAAVYLYLYQRCNKEDQCFPSIRTICRDMKLSRSTVKRALSDLTRAGFVIKERRYRESGANSSNLYILRN
ncbi:MAG: helix-turn-helix domain-containing protein [Clostridia bacterium]|nr:helix-turn-helix domain-containing protein [Clostridia bacterium]